MLSCLETLYHVARMWGGLPPLPTVLVPGKAFTELLAVKPWLADILVAPACGPSKRSFTSPETSGESGYPGSGMETMGGTSRRHSGLIK